MSGYRKRLILVAFMIAAIVVAVGSFRLWRANLQPLGESKPVRFPSMADSDPEVQHFLDGNFGLITKVESLPQSVLATFTEQGGSRLLMANPGKKFEATDVILDASVPQKRLMFAGASTAKCFVHYEQGGRAHSYVLAFFKLAPGNSIEAVWQGYCDDPVSNLQELRSKVKNGSCSKAPYRHK